MHKASAGNVYQCACNLLAVLSAALSMGLPDGVFEFLMRSLTRAAYGV